MSRLLPTFRGRGESASSEPEPDAGARSAGGGVARKVLTAVAVGGAAYLAARRLRSSDRADDGSEQEESDLSITDSGDEEATEPLEDAPGEEHTPEEIAERVGGDVDEKPAEPGEMAIDEAIVEDAVDEVELSGTGEDESEGETANDGESDEADDGEEQIS